MTEQVAVCVRYINQKCKAKEDFLQFFEAVVSLKGRDLAETIIKGLSSCGVDCEFMIGQGYDGAVNMAGENLMVCRLLSGNCTQKHSMYIEQQTR